MRLCLKLTGAMVHPCQQQTRNRTYRLGSEEILRHLDNHYQDVSQVLVVLLLQHRVYLSANSTLHHPVDRMLLHNLEAKTFLVQSDAQTAVEALVEHHQI